MPCSTRSSTRSDRAAPPPKLKGSCSLSEHGSFNFGRAGECERGQAAVEVALLLPVVVLLALVLVQVGLVLRDQVLVVHVAREAARAAAVDPRPAVAEAAAREGARLDPDRLEVETTVDEMAGHVRVEVRYPVPTDLPLLGPLVGDLPVTADATMALEGP